MTAGLKRRLEKVERARAAAGQTVCIFRLPQWSDADVVREIAREREARHLGPHDRVYVMEWDWPPGVVWPTDPPNGREP